MGLEQLHGSLVVFLGTVNHFEAGGVGESPVEVDGGGVSFALMNPVERFEDDVVRDAACREVPAVNGVDDFERGVVMMVGSVGSTDGDTGITTAAGIYGSSVNAGSFS